MKDVTVLICSGVHGLSIFVNFSSWFNSRKFEYIIWKYWYKLFRLLVFLLHSKKKWNSSSKALQIAHSLWSLGILRYLPIPIKSLWSLSLNFHGINWLMPSEKRRKRIRKLKDLKLLILTVFSSEYILMEITVLFLKLFRHQVWFDGRKYPLRVASKLNLRLSNLQLMPENLQIQYCYLVSVTNSIINPSALLREKLVG
jgi:hypothetical protein